MSIHNKIRNVLPMAFAVAIAIPILTPQSAHAATMSVSQTAPVVNGLDIASLPTTGTGAGSKYWIWDGDSPGQSFTIGADDAELNAITMRVWSTSGSTSNKTHDLWIGEISGSSYVGTPVNEVASQPMAWASDDYVTFTLDTPILMSANTTYAFDTVMTQSAGGWQSGIPYLHTSGGNLYTDGAKTSTGVSRPTDHAINFNTDTRGNDMVFHLDMSAIAAVPEPTTTALLGLGGLALILRRRK